MPRTSSFDLAAKTARRWRPAQGIVLRISAAILLFLVAAAPMKPRSRFTVMPPQVASELGQRVEVQWDDLVGTEVSLTSRATGLSPLIRVGYSVWGNLESVRLPAAIPPGRYDLCVKFPAEWPESECRSLEVRAFKTFVEVNKKQLFNRRKEKIELSIQISDTWEWVALQRLGTGEMSDKFRLRQVTKTEHLLKLAADVAPNLSAGQFDLLLFRRGDAQGYNAGTIEVKTPPAVSIVAVEPPWIRRYRDKPATVTIVGQGLAEVTSASLLGEGCQQQNGVSCSLASQTDSELVFQIKPFASLGGTSALVLTDGAKVPLLKEIGILQPIVPWDEESWIVFVALLLAGSLMVAIIQLKLRPCERDQPALGLHGLAKPLFLALLTFLGSTLLVTIAWGLLGNGLKTINLPFVGTTALLGLNIWWPFGFVVIRRKLAPRRQVSWWPAMIAAALALLILAGPFVLDAFDLLQWGLPGEAGLLGLILLSGGMAIAKARDGRQRPLGSSTLEGNRHDLVHRDYSQPQETTMQQDLTGSAPESTRRVFISYSHQDSHFVEKLAQDLEQAGIRIWIDRLELAVGDSMIEGVSRGLEESADVVVVLSQASIQSQWVQTELRAKLTQVLSEKGGRVLPVLIERDVRLPFLIGDLRYADFRVDYKQGLKALLDALRAPRSAVAPAAHATDRPAPQLRPTTMAPKWNRQDLRRLILREFNEAEARVLWFDTLGESAPVTSPPLSYSDLVIRLLTETVSRGLQEELLLNIRSARPDLPL